MNILAMCLNFESTSRYIKRFYAKNQSQRVIARDNSCNNALLRVTFLNTGYNA